MEGPAVRTLIVLIALVTTLTPSGAPIAAGKSKGAAAAAALATAIDQHAAAALPHVIAWRHDFHQNPELSNHETRTAGIVAEHLKSLGLTVKTGVAHNGVMGVLVGGAPGPVVALRADMDALPVTEDVDVPFASHVRSTYNGQEVGVMHACGHDAHTAILMGVAEVLAAMRQNVPGTVLFIFQPAEEGVPEGEEGGARLMIKEGVLANPRPEAIFGLHVLSPDEVGTIRVRPGGFFASSDVLRIVVKGRQTHGARPWAGIDPVVVSAQIINALQTITSRQIDVTRSPGIVTVATIHGGVRNNIIPDQVEMTGTIRALDENIRQEIHKRVKTTAEMVAAAAGATAEVTITEGNPITFNDPDLTRKMEPTLRRVAGPTRVDMQGDAILGAEDFAAYQQVIPGVYVILGLRSAATPVDGFPSNHSPKFRIDEEDKVLLLGVRTLASMAVDYNSGAR